ncbi:MAG: DUF4191 domain-containing protein [Solirubrobacterales bacterium]|jgi:hypothetical protein|nr:DUF4191 domain-containing protein [Solirubrobacterales bacterium]
MARSSDAPAKPKKQRWYRTLWQAYRFTAETDPAVTWWIVGAFVVIMGIATGVGIGLGRVWYFLILGLPLALVVMMFVLARRTEAAGYKRIEGQPGAALSALRTVRGWDFPDDPVDLNARTMDLVFRGSGRGGVLLVSEGPPHRVRPMLEQQRKRVSRVLPNVPVTVIQCGDAEGQVPLRQLAKRVRKIRPKLDRRATDEVTKRLRALGGAKLPVPKGVDPLRVRPDRKGLRGR